MSKWKLNFSKKKFPQKTNAWLLMNQAGRIYGPNGLAQIKGNIVIDPEERNFFTSAKEAVEFALSRGWHESDGWLVVLYEIFPI